MTNKGRVGIKDTETWKQNSKFSSRYKACSALKPSVKGDPCVFVFFQQYGIWEGMFLSGSGGLLSM